MQVVMVFSYNTLLILFFTDNSQHVDSGKSEEGPDIASLPQQETMEADDNMVVIEKVVCFPP